MEQFMYYLQMILSYAMALAQILMYLFIAIFAIRVAKPLCTALKTYSENHKKEATAESFAAMPEKVPAPVVPVAEASAE